MNWDDLKFVDAAARMRSLSGAARALNLSQPQLSRRLRQFEDKIGARLFERTPSGLKPTEAGLRLIPLAADMRARADAAERTLPDLAGSALRVVRIAVDEVRARIIADNLAFLMEQLEGIEVELISSHHHADHENRGTELQIRNCLPESDTLVARKLGLMTYAVYGAETYISRHPQAATDLRYDTCRWIGFAPDNLWYPAQARWLDGRLSRRPDLRTNTMTTALDMAAGGIGLALLPVFMGDQTPGLRRLTPPLAELTNTEHIVVHRDLKREPAVRRTIDAVVALYRLSANLLSGTKRLQEAG